MKLTPELKNRIDEYFLKASFEDIIKVFCSDDSIKEKRQHRVDHAIINAEDLGYTGDTDYIRYSEYLLKQENPEKEELILMLGVMVHYCKEVFTLPKLNINLIIDSLEENMYKIPTNAEEFSHNIDCQEQIDILKKI